MFLNISSISILSNRFLKILSKFFIQLRASELNFVEPQIGACYNIEPIYPSFKSISKLFLSFSINFSISSLLLPASPGGAKRDIIYHLILLCQAEFYFLFVFYSARLVPSPSVGGEQGHNIAQPRNLSNVFRDFFCFFRPSLLNSAQNAHFLQSKSPLPCSKSAETGSFPFQKNQAITAKLLFISVSIRAPRSVQLPA